MLQISSATKIGLRDYQEDRLVVDPRAREGTLLAVMDGHGGDTVAQVCRDYLSAFWDLAVITDKGDVRPFENALALVIAQLDAITGEYHSGSTISLAFIPKDETKVYVAVVGDSPVVVRTSHNVVSISPTHNVRGNLDERDAAEMRGGVYEGGYIWESPYQNHGLQMARALGDGQMGSVISKTPDLLTYELGSFALLATDGCFDPSHKSESAAIVEVVNLIDHGADATNIVERAVALKTGDNATAIVVRKYDNIS